jgi:hypothetical protein
MATEELIVLLDARTAKLDKKLNSTNEKLDRLTEKSQKSDGGLRKLGSGAKVAADLVLKTALAATALAAAISTIVIASAKARRELELLAKQAKTSTSDFQALAFATNTYGINAEQMGDISKEISLKIAEFSTAGTGAFQDYADVMKLTKEQAREAAEEFVGLSSQEVLGMMISRMEGAGATAGDMEFAIDSLASDAERLIPLFKGNSQELLELKRRFDDVNSSLQITGTQAEALRDVSNTFTLLTSSAGNATTAISATLAPVLDDFFNDIIAIVPDATQTIIDFVNSFLDAENITSIAGVNKEIETSLDRIAEKEKLIATQKGHTKRVAEGHLREESQRLESLELQLAVLKEQEKSLENANRLKGGEIGGETGEELSSDQGLGTGDEIQAIEDRFKLEETLLAEKLVRELLIIGDNNELKLELEQEFADNINQIREKSSKDKIKIDEQRQKTEQSLERSNISSIMSIISALVGHNSDVGKALFIASQGLAASEVFFNTQVASMKALAQLGPIAGPPVAAAIQTSGGLSIAAIAATTFGSLTSSGGGGGGGAISASATSSDQTQDSFNPSTSDIGLDFRGEDSQTSNIIRFDTETGDQLLDALMGALNDGMRNGRG